MKTTRARRLINILLILALIAMPTMTVFAQSEEDCGFLGINCNPVVRLLENIFNWLGNTFNGFIEWIQNAIGWFRTTIENVWNVILGVFDLITEVINGVLRLIEEALAIAQMLVDIFLALVKLLAEWLAQAVAKLGEFVASYTTITPTPIPGLPHCITAPLDHDLCALWYMSDYTFFAPSTPGNLVFPIIVILVDVTILFVFSRKIFRFLKMGESITDVE